MSRLEDVLDLFQGARLTAFRRALLTWYRQHHRRLPWRETRDPYVVWISEIMLQQTTVTAVVPYFQRFLQRFPDVAALAEAPEEDVLRLWEGLGYYSRARNLHKAARVIVAERQGRFPADADALQSLPGIGRYTAGAIASFAFDQPAPIVEANTLRLYCRLLGYAGDPRSADGQRRLWEFAEHLLPQRGPGEMNQALMELGATLCAPDTPGCDRCPVNCWCAALSQGKQHEIPQAARRPQLTDVTEVAVAVRKGNRYLLLKRQPGERWAGLWDFVRFAWEDAAPSETRKRKRDASPNGEDCKLRIENCKSEVGRRVEELVGVCGEVERQLTVIRHGVTRYRIALHCFVAEWTSGQPRGSGESRWVPVDELAELPLSTTGRKIAQLL